MSAGAAERDLRPPTERPKRLLRAGNRLKQAQARFDRFAAAVQVENEDVRPQTLEDTKALQDELQAAQEEFLGLYAEFLRNDPDFQQKSLAAELRLAKGPPWDDVITPSDLAGESGLTDH